MNSRTKSAKANWCLQLDYLKQVSLPLIDHLRILS